MTNVLSSSHPHTLNTLNIFNELNMIRQRNFCTNAIRKIDIIITIKKPFSYFFYYEKRK